jgi:hypothetical protein
MQPELLGISNRQVKPLHKAYRDNGAMGPVYKQRGQAGNHRLKTETVGKVLELIPPGSRFKF